MKKALTVTLLAVCALAFAPWLQAQQPCSNQTFRGAYLFYCQASSDLSVLNPALPANTIVPYTASGRLYLDGRGGGSMTMKAKVGGNTGAMKMDVKVTVNEDCTAEGELQNVSLSGTALGREVYTAIGTKDGKEFVSMSLGKSVTSPMVCVAKRIGEPGTE